MGAGAGTDFQVLRGRSYVLSVSLPDRYLWITLDNSV